MAKSQYYPGLDLLRFIAAILVILDHFGLFALNYPSATGPVADRAFPFLSPMTSIGSIGIEIFFLISGFIIPASSLGLSAKTFAYRRAIRVLPALWVSGLIAFAARLATGEPVAALAGDLCRSAILSPLGLYIDGVVWTLVVEAVFYLVIFGSILWAGMKNITQLIYAIGSLSIIYISIYWLTTLMSPHHALALKATEILGRFPFKVFLMRYGMFFALGMAIWCYSSAETSRINFIFFLALVAFCLIEILYDRPGLGEGGSAILIWLVALNVLIISALRPSWISIKSDSSNRLSRQLGLLSYPLYLNHYTLGMCLVAFFARTGFSVTAIFALALSVVFVISYFIMILPERAIQKRLLAMI